MSRARSGEALRGRLHAGGRGADRCALSSSGGHGLAGHRAADLDGVLEHCERLDELPLRGTPRDDIRVGLRVTVYQGRTVIAYVVEADRVAIVGLFHGGQDYEARLQGAPVTRGP